GFEVRTPYGVDDLRKADTIVVPAAYNGSPADYPKLLDALRAAHRRGARVMSFCTGAFVLGDAGLLDGRRATTHWAYAEEFAARFPAVRLDPGVLYVDEGNVLTSAGTSAGIDLCLHVVRMDYGADVANAVARRMVVPPHRDGGQAQYVDDPMPAGPGADLFGDTMAWLQEHLAEPLTVEDLARRSAMSSRTFARRFRATAGTTPMQWVLRQRVLLAQRLLETSDEPIDRIAELAGFGSPAALRQHFNRMVRTSPTAYRRAFRQEEPVA
ncbi:MAG: helix-turn-helix domain-containing protein, partial [Acidimicrobiia bacterium]|nr:helix-turn-helix domain-containing protein [Acidimicrobiia bacterium]